MISPINHNVFLKYALITCWLLTATIGYHGFFKNHELLTVPLFNIAIPESIIYLSAITMFLSAILGVITKPVTGTYLYLLSLACYIIICIADVHRITPYMMVFFALFACFTFLKHDRHIFYTALIFTLSGIYIFSGLHKFNTGFVTDIAPRFYFHSLPLSYDIKIGYTMAATEVLLGMLLLFKSTRRIATVILIFMHAIILWKLSPWKYVWNYIVIPWNSIMIFSLVYLFKQSVVSRFKIGSGRSVLIALAVVIWVIPCVSQFLPLSENISLKLYSGQSIPGYISFTSKEAYFESMNRSKDDQFMIISLQQFSMEERGIAFNPEVTYYNEVFSRFREKYASTNQLHLKRFKEVQNQLQKL